MKIMKQNIYGNCNPHSGKCANNQSIPIFKSKVKISKDNKDNNKGSINSKEDSKKF